MTEESILLFDNSKFSLVNSIIAVEKSNVNMDGSLKVNLGCIETYSNSNFTKKMGDW